MLNILNQNCPIMKLASAQIHPEDGNIQKNLEEHYRLIKQAAEKGADLIVFPEMSITGYARENAREIAFLKSDNRLDQLQKLATDHQIMIVAGAPIKVGTDLFIGSFIFQPGSLLKIYTKQFLHSGEEKYFNNSFDYNPLIQFGEERISFAICADIDNPQHAENAYNLQSTLYVSSIFNSPYGILEGHSMLGSYAKKYGMNVIMSNFCGKSWEMDAGGKSAFWDNQGNIICEMNHTNPGFLTVEKTGKGWKGETIY